MTPLSVTHYQRHPWLSVDLTKKHSQLKSRSFFLNTAKKVSYLSVAIMSASTLLLPLFINAMAARVILGISTMILVPFLAKTTIYFQNEYKSVKSRLESNKLILNVFERIKNWDSMMIEEFFNAQHILPPIDCDLRDLLPVIARYKSRENQATMEEEKSDQQLLADDLPEDLKFESREKGWRTLERNVLPLKIEAAYCLQILKEPTLNTSYDELTRTRQKTFARRQYDRIYAKEDNYLRMIPDKRWITLEDVQKSTIHKLNQLMFPKKPECSVRSVDSPAKDVPKSTCHETLA